MGIPRSPLPLVWPRYRCGMGRKTESASVASSGGSDGESLRAVLDGLRSIADPEDPRWRPGLADARAIVDGAWSVLAEALDDKPQAGAVVADFGERRPQPHTHSRSSERARRDSNPLTF